MENTTNNKRKSKGLDVKFLIIGLVALVAIAIIVAILVSKTGKKVVSKESSKAEIVEKLDIDIKDPEEAEEVSYDIENNSIAKVSYAKTMPNGETMHFVMRSSYAMEEDLATFDTSVDFPDDQPIYMTVICEDGAEVEVESYVALDGQNKMKYMKATWMDNDKYYAMVTDDLITREDFLQEVNRVIIANHIPF